MVPILSNYLYRFISNLLKATKSLNTAILQTLAEEIPLCLKYNIKIKMKYVFRLTQLSFSFIVSIIGY